MQGVGFRGLLAAGTSVMPDWLVCHAKPSWTPSLGVQVVYSITYFQVLTLCTRLTDTNTGAVAAEENPKVGRAAGSAAQVQQRAPGTTCVCLGLVFGACFVPLSGVWSSGYLPARNPGNAVIN